VLLERFMGEGAEDPGARLAMAAVIAAVKHYGIDPRDARLVVAVNRADAAADALMALTGATLAGGRLRFLPSEKRLRFRFRFAHRGRWLELRETEEPARKPGLTVSPLDNVSSAPVRQGSGAGR
jgi:hypothetical protein